MEPQTPHNLLPLTLLLPFVILLEGFVSISVEILTIRQLLPVVGGSVVVTSLIIGIFLLFLAWGYQYGGKPRTNPGASLSNNFFIAALWLGIGLSYFFISFFFFGFQKISGTHAFYPLIVFLLLIIAPLIFILGQTVPITMNMAQSKLSAGTIGGNTLGLSTLGSFLGAILTTLVFMYYFGVAWTLFIDVLLLMMLALLLTENYQILFSKSLIALGMIALIFIMNISVEKHFFALTNNYANYQIIDENNGKKTLVINDTLSSSINNKNQGFPYIEAIKKILFNDLNLKDANILILGAGGFTITANGTHGNHFTYVDIDTQLKKVAVPKFINTLNSKLMIDDARHFLKTSTEQYNVIISDAYSDVRTVPAHLLSAEYLQEIKQRLLPNGAAIFNIIANPTMHDAYSRHVDNTIRHVFQHCMIVPNSYANRDTNVLYICTNEPNPDRNYYTDNLNNSTIDSFIR